VLLFLKCTLTLSSHAAKSVTKYPLQMIFKIEAYPGRYHA